MHKNGHFLKRINGTTSIKDLKKAQHEDTVLNLKEMYRNVDKELEIMRKQKRDRVRAFYAKRSDSEEQIERQRIV